MVSLIGVIREFRDFSWRVLTYRKRFVDIMGVRLAIDDSRISNRMRYVLCRGYETDDAMVVQQLVNNDDCVLECGSSVGFLSLYARKVIGVKRYAMVEANPELMGLMNKNYFLNGVSKPSCCFNYAVCASDCEIDFGINRNFWSSSLAERAGTNKFVKVKGRTLTSIVSSLEFSPNVLIMDIEGAEIEVAADSFKNFEKIIIEIHPKITGQRQADGFVDRLISAGYRVACKRGSTLGLLRTEEVSV